MQQQSADRRGLHCCIGCDSSVINLDPPSRTPQSVPLELYSVVGLLPPASLVPNPWEAKSRSINCSLFAYKLANSNIIFRGLSKPGPPTPAHLQQACERGRRRWSRKPQGRKARPTRPRPEWLPLREEQAPELDRDRVVPGGAARFAAGEFANRQYEGHEPGCDQRTAARGRRHYLREASARPLPLQSPRTSRIFPRRGREQLAQSTFEMRAETYATRR